MSAVILKRDPATAERVREILGLPNDQWTDCSVEFGTDQPAIATVTLVITKEQLRKLVDAAVVVG